jgi:phytoene dehydrogenase-like protein
MLKLIAANGDVLFHLEGKAEPEESAEIFKFPYTAHEPVTFQGAPVVWDDITQAANTFWRRRPIDAARQAQRLENLQREMDAVLTNPNVFTRLADQQIFTAAQERERAGQRRMAEEMRRTVEDLRVDSIDEEDEVDF